MRIDVISLFPEMFAALQHTIPGRAIRNQQLELNIINLRDYAINKYGQVDDTAYGGEAGMVLRPEPLYDAIIATGAPDKGTPVIYLSPQGSPLKQSDSIELAQVDHLVLVCGHYKGIDERICEELITREISIGDYVLTGGELPAMVLIDSIIRLVPGVMGNFESAETDSFYGNTLGWPVYTRPEEFRGRKVPEILLSGHHARIREWQKEQSLQRTQERRPDILKKNEIEIKEQGRLNK
jgi:tRNA (guanine37-N1)-methyltransferase